MSKYLSSSNASNEITSSKNSKKNTNWHGVFNTLSDDLSIFSPIADAYSSAPDYIGIRKNGTFLLRKYSKRTANGSYKTYSGKPLQTTGNYVGLTLMGIDIISTFGNLDKFQSMEDFWITYIDWAVPTILSAIGNTLGATLCLSTGIGTSVCAGIGSAIGSAIGNGIVHYPLNDCETFSNNPYARANAGIVGNNKF
jgi:hypothetical protein